MSDREGRLADGEIYYRAWDAPGARANVVLSHGYAEHSGRYEHVAAALVKTGFAVWAIDHRGHGQSAGDRADVVGWESVVTDLDLVVELAKSESPGLPAYLVGHSLGGAIAIAYTLVHQEKLAGLALSAPAISFPPELLALATMDEIPALPLADGVSRDPAVVQAYKDDPLNYFGPPPMNVLGIMATTATQTDRLSEFTLPVQIMQGSSDALISVDAFKMVVSGVSSTDIEARLWPGFFHEIFNEPEQAEVIGQLVSWIDHRVG